jgi:hypothetical protein
MQGGDREESHRSSGSAGPGSRDDSLGAVGEGVRGIEDAPAAVDPGIADALDVVAKARLEKEWEA